ncbi:hypothetical protein I5I01_gp53 [Mycobacterium phage MooMoo]|uniref:Uncharacterized protein n=1 Tax=Mycobacterium phage MooMoo TaxID=2108127 RepID=A0A2P1JR72_9CAUD|nr:hypothetical protein I5I01_gp53 [Mycobacterium phage MooMoo]AVO21658.1 hypothetical protein SEA_MOOMOO_53 [Mycobacterium phage MooMoo]
MSLIDPVPGPWRDRFADLPVTMNAPHPDPGFLTELEDLAESVLIQLDFIKLFAPQDLPTHWVDDQLVETEAFIASRPAPIPQPPANRRSHFAAGKWRTIRKGGAA